MNSVCDGYSKHQTTVLYQVTTCEENKQHGIKIEDCPIYARIDTRMNSITGSDAPSVCASRAGLIRPRTTKSPI